MSEPVVVTLDELFSDHNIDVQSENYNKAVDIVQFPCVHKKDSEPVTLIWPDEQHGPWIAGGAPLRWWQGQTVDESDIDIFCANAKQLEDVLQRIKSYGRWTKKFESENAITLYYWGKENYAQGWTLQIIKRRFFSSLQEVIDSFDMTVCEIGTGGNSWLLNKQTAKDIRERNLRLKIPLQPDAVKRLVKYWTYGYRPVDGLIEAVQNNPIGKWEFAIDEDYNNAF